MRCTSHHGQYEIAFISELIAVVSFVSRFIRIYFTLIALLNMYFVCIRQPMNYTIDADKLNFT